MRRLVYFFCPYLECSKKSLQRQAVFLNNSPMLVPVRTVPNIICNKPVGSPRTTTRPTRKTCVYLSNDSDCTDRMCCSVAISQMLLYCSEFLQLRINSMFAGAKPCSFASASASELLAYWNMFLLVCIWFHQLNEKMSCQAGVSVNANTLFLSLGCIYFFCIP